MNFDDLKDQLREQWEVLRSRIEESPAYNNIKEQFTALPARTQKIITVALGVLVAVIIVSIPYTYFSSSSTSVADFEENRGLIRSLLRAGRPDLSGAGNANKMDVAALKQRLSSFLGITNLLPEQIGEIEELASTQGSLAKPPIKEEALRIQLKTLNLNQVVDIGYRLQSQFKNVKMTGLDIVSSAKAGYYDVKFVMSQFSLPAEESDAPKNKRNNRRKRK